MRTVSIVKKLQQSKSDEWLDQWSRFTDDHPFLLEDWIKPVTLSSLEGKRILECGCGGGHHTARFAEHAAYVTAVDLNCAELASKRGAGLKNVDFVSDDIAHMDLGKTFDVVACIGVIHHTDNPDRTFETMYHHCRPGGEMIIWTYSAEGNGPMRYLVEPLREIFFRHLPRWLLHAISAAITAVMYPIVHTIYRLPLKWLPYWQYFANFRKLTFKRNLLNVFDKLNAPQTKFTTLQTAKKWMSEERFEADSLSITPYVGVSWRLYGVKKGGNGFYEAE